MNATNYKIENLALFLGEDSRINCLTALNVEEGLTQAHK